ncbi:sodium pump decarboxylases, gamma subunit [Caminicella sporogenes DSM 14501]|uniref:Sodium pump decarboxylases, gamma subunit n=1 Tax=Caminicella sporogenes DSM 14501 TaxID=1121266 RepID=A0A1M6QR62_9FIRM|nr:OadG family protein [Caminicella sporogenes]SHK22779.1 sodium pump decarboxylases, gamma subunit [Caminicella sporogenes DSM 14501]
MGLLEKFTSPELIHSLSLGEKLLASIYVTILGMSATFAALIILWGCIIIMSKLLNTSKPKEETVEVKSVPTSQVNVSVPEVEENDEELVAVITAAIAASLNTSTHNIIVKNIIRIPDTTPVWGKAGRLEQMNRML